MMTSVNNNWLGNYLYSIYRQMKELK